ncbi:MAG: poly(R)-hydroxyalkanoic acid synthase subunit PhaE [Arenicellales bacterium]
MNKEVSADWASALLGLHQLLREQLDKASPGVAPMNMPHATDWLQTLVGMNPANSLAGSPGFHLPPAPSGEGATWESAAGRYREAALALQAAWLQISSDALADLREALDEDHAPQNLRGIYDLWVSCAEAVFARQSLTENYANLVSELINSQVALQLAAGIGSAPAPDDPAQLKEALAAATAREARLRADLEALRQADSASPSPAKKRASKKPGVSAKAKAVKKKAGSTGASQKTRGNATEKTNTKDRPAK